ncbi:thioesterase II family protein [Nocardia sp. NBC_01388]|uniref:thioesterase II family protein n=1 Tax=Nocardia sp. NBC_01388 TaxID=2903596 RepID=UPI003245397D
MAAVAPSRAVLPELRTRDSTTGVCNHRRVSNLKLVCLPFAGSGASFFRNTKSPEGIDLLPIQLPGHEERFIDPPFVDVRTAAAEVADYVRAESDSDSRILVFGHSMGAILAFETALALGAMVDHVFVSGSPDPWHPRSERASTLTDEEFMAKVEAFAGYTHPALANPEMRQLILPILRADVLMHESYIAGSDTVIDVPITALRGTGDALVSEADMLGWRNATTSNFSIETVQGGHMYLADRLEETLEFIAETTRISHGK